ncbi:ribose 5-phosphate isomerase A [Candidatus Kinetoplastibacterium blastocrithidii TCC012E]|uniref:Ribose-5-phosphate isomerase A n=1 Tax=Candidatus Kinetoplastidibacterium blastocrithidiae TCC012E TaxID=1208922 RepID=M1MCX2_9PROT|nr:ribose-5-phosphate isomerase RpiA [Candidatus Kinetoplastibacterium blastocrithidii]AFZ83889.1 ribose-5-phosphate isomerase A [Candidatus Kinetoplastibacterium blastocrithidii (ex Strigomonas culicis)]AGF49630.1 ribose 5-phosphate isomerase A [Candidatus Kinetoplastibacterium blastocrithidii TCC012E]
MNIDTRQINLKQEASRAAMNFITPYILENNNFLIGVGTGSTVDFFIDELSCFSCSIAGAVASSDRTKSKLSSCGIKVIELNSIDHLPFYVDGADEIDESFCMIKGGGGALTREKIVSSVADKFICIVDESKLVNRLGSFPLPIEVIPMAVNSISRRLTLLGGKVVLRDGFITDNGNVIIDVHNLYIQDQLSLEKEINNFPGVVTNGLFAINRADILILAADEGVQLIHRY